MFAYKLNCDRLVLWDGDLINLVLQTCVAGNIICMCMTQRVGNGARASVYLNN